MITLKTEPEIELMRVAGRCVAQILCELEELVKPGVTTGQIDRKAEALCKKMNVVPIFKGYHGYPATICISVNEEVVHGIPNDKRFLNEGDIVGLDFGVSHLGWFGDSAKTFAVGKISEEAKKLLDVTAEGLRRGIAQMHVGNYLFDIGHAIQSYVESHNYGVVRDFVGHGIGRSLHESPQVPNFGAKGKGVPLREGMVLAVEPMINAGAPEVRVLADGWTAVTVDHSLSAHFEHTIAITKNGPDILTLA